MNWQDMYRTALLGHGLSPQAFWALSWREWLWLNPLKTQSLARGTFEALRAQFPDR